MPTTHNDVEQEPEHNVLQWAKVRKRAILNKTTYQDTELASRWQKDVIHQIQLAIRSVTEEDTDGFEEDE